MIHGARKGQKTISSVRDVLLLIPSLRRTCSEPFLSFVGPYSYRIITSFVQEIASSIRMQCFTLQYGQGFA